MNAHPTDEHLNDWVDGLLDAAEAEGVAAHVAGCAECRGTEAQLRALLARAADLPPSIEPPAGTWEAITARTIDLGRTRRAVLHGLRVPLAAAAVLLVAVTAGATALLLRAGTAQAPAVAATDVAPAPSGVQGVLVAAEDTYQQEFDRLITEFRANRASLDSTTIAVVEENLVIIEQALAQARAALAADPANVELPLLITKTHQQRIALIERALRLSTRPERSEA